MLGARGFWVASTIGLTLAALSLSGLLLLVLQAPVAARGRRRRYGPGVKLTLAAASAGTASMPSPAAGETMPKCGVRPSVPSARPSATHTAISGVER